MTLLPAHSFTQTSAPASASLGPERHNLRLWPEACHKCACEIDLFERLAEAHDAREPILRQLSIATCQDHRQIRAFGLESVNL
ncbi:hypothetical protein ACSD7O_03255 [Methylorubrum extorquens]|jgi:hypothetical protein|uniref:hypothetical protein n=1 Tax=Methylorubrum extorquens TaxID=408 RepID=UPI003F5E23CF